MKPTFTLAGNACNAWIARPHAATGAVSVLFTTTTACGLPMDTVAIATLRRSGSGTDHIGASPC